jgi:hypothetical protein
VSRFIYYYADCHYAECSYDKRHYGKCHYAECSYAEYRYSECHYAECSLLSVGVPLRVLAFIHNFENFILMASEEKTEWNVLKHFYGIVTFFIMTVSRMTMSRITISQNDTVAKLFQAKLSPLSFHLTYLPLA